MRFFIVFLVTHYITYGTTAQQNETRFFWEAPVAVNYKVTDNWTFNTSINHRSRWSSVQTNTDSRFVGDVSFIEINHFATYKISTKWKSSLGYKYRWIDPPDSFADYEHRLTQQLAYVHFKDVVRLVSRLRLEQRFQDDAFAHRYRYRISADSPLSGATLDPREFYVVGSTEVLFEAVNVEEDTWEIRGSGSIGYQFNPKAKMELGLTYRLENVTRSIEDLVFIDTALFLNLN